MDLSCSLDVLVRKDVAPGAPRGNPDPMTRVIHATQERIGAAFKGHTKKAVTYKKR